MGKQRLLIGCGGAFIAAQQHRDIPRANSLSAYQCSALQKLSDFGCNIRSLAVRPFGFFRFFPASFLFRRKQRDFGAALQRGLLFRKVARDKAIPLLIRYLRANRRKQRFKYGVCKR